MCRYKGDEKEVQNGENKLCGRGYQTYVSALQTKKHTEKIKEPQIR